MHLLRIGATKKPSLAHEGRLSMGTFRLASTHPVCATAKLTDDWATDFNDAWAGWAIDFKKIRFH